MKKLDDILNSAYNNAYSIKSDISFSDAGKEYARNSAPPADSALVEAQAVEFNVEGGNLPSSRFFASIGSAYFEGFFNKGRQKRLIVFFSGARTRNNGRDVAPYPTFSSWSWYSKTSASVLCLDDPMYHTYPSLALGWFYGTENEDYRQNTALLICKIASLLGIDNSDIVLYGRSGGGTAAICISAFIEGSSAVAINPQLDIENYRFNKDFSEITGINPSDEAFKARNDFEKIIRGNPDNTFMIISNLASETDYDVDLKYLKSRFALDLKYGVCSCDNLFLWIYYACGETNPHNAFDNPALFRMIITALECAKEAGGIPSSIISFANDYWAERYELLSRKREINQKAVLRGVEIKELKAQLAEKEKELSDLKTQKPKGIFSKFKK